MSFTNIKDVLADIFSQAAGDEVEITESTKEVFGHYQCNSALKIGKKLGVNPRDVANQITAKVTKTPLIEKLEIAGPGFINIYLSVPYLANELKEILFDEKLGVPLPKKQETIICDFSSPNIAKAMHVGHLRSTIIGDSIARLFEFLGHNVKRLNHVGDFGTQFGMLISYIKEFAKDAFSGSSQPHLEDLMQWYKDAKKEFDLSPSFKKRAQEEVVKLQQGEESSVLIWKKICQISMKAFHEIYARLRVHLEERGESFYSPYLQEVVQDFEKKGLLSVDNGAKCVYLEGFTNKEGERLPLIIQKGDGGFNYATTDLAGFRYRVFHDKADRIVIVTDSGQSLHFKMVYEAACKVGYIDPEKTRFDHVPFGLVLAPDGKKFKTREGETERLSDLLDEAVLHAKNLLQDREIDNIDQAAEVLGIDSIKYADLCCNRIKDYTFSYERMLKFEGNTAAFILYAYVRIQSIKRRLKDQAVDTSFPLSLDHPSEFALGLHLRRFGEVLYDMNEDLLPNRLAEYLFHLAEKFHAFFRDCHVEGTPEEKSRLILCSLTEKILRKGLYILGLETIEKM